MRFWPLNFALVVSAALLLSGGMTKTANAGPALVFDSATGQVIYAEDQDDSWYPASLTKIMTAYLAFEALKAGKLTLEQKIPVSETANLQPPSKVGLPVGGELTVDVALQALIVKSANDVAVMLAEAIAGSETAFIYKMNETAKRLGMTKTTFVNPNGLPAPDQSTTARDLAKLTRAVITQYPQYAHYWAMTEMHIGKIKLASHNALLKTFEGADGFKTGFTCDAGFNVVASATRENRRMVAVVLGEPNGNIRAIRAASLLEHGFSLQGWKTMFNATTIDNLAAANEAKNLVSMRQTITSWSCGNGPKKAKTAKKGNKVGELKEKVAAAKAKAKPTAKTDAPAAPPVKKPAAATATP